MTNRLKAYARRTILEAAREYAYPKKRRTPESTESAFRDAMRGTGTGWWNDLIYTAPMLDMAHKYRRDIATALAEYRDATGESYVSRENDREMTAEDILGALMHPRPYTWEEYRDTAARGIGDRADAALLGLRFAVEWFAGELASEYAPEL